MLKNTQKKIVNLGEQCLRKTGLSDKTLCKILRILHIAIFLIIVLFLLFGSKKMFFITVIATLSIYILFLIFNACIFTKLEYRFASDDFNVVDPLLIVLLKECNKKNRYNITIILNGFVGLSMPLLYYLRFARNNEISLL